MLDPKLFEDCKWCNGSGNDGTGVCPDCECTGMKGGQYALKEFDNYIEWVRKNADTSKTNC